MDGQIGHMVSTNILGVSLLIKKYTSFERPWLDPRKPHKNSLKIKLFQTVNKL